MKNYSLIIAALAFLCSCTANNGQNEPVQEPIDETSICIEAYLGDFPVKTSISTKSSYKGDVLFKWSEGDAIGVVVTDGRQYELVRCTADRTHEIAVFKGNKKEGWEISGRAYYPFDDIVSYKRKGNDDIVVFNLPKSNGGIIPLMGNIQEDGSFEFTHTGGAIEVAFSGLEEGSYTFSLSSNRYTYGHYTLDDGALNHDSTYSYFKTDGDPGTMDESTTVEYKLNTDGNGGLKALVALAPATYEWISFKLTDSANEVVYSSGSKNKNIRIDRCTLAYFGPLSMKGDDSLLGDDVNDTDICFKATIATSELSQSMKSSIDNAEEMEPITVVWNEGDQVLYPVTNGKDVLFITCSAHLEGNSAKFTGKKEKGWSSCGKAMFPVCDSSVFYYSAGDEIIKFMLAQDIDMRDRSTVNIPMMGLKQDDGDYSFSHVCGGVKSTFINLPGDGPFTAFFMGNRWTWGLYEYSEIIGSLSHNSCFSYFNNYYEKWQNGDPGTLVDATTTKVTFNPKSDGSAEVFYPLTSADYGWHRVELYDAKGKMIYYGGSKNWNISIGDGRIVSLPVVDMDNLSDDERR